jgi:hypothetical protein
MRREIAIVLFIAARSAKTLAVIKAPTYAPIKALLGARA